MGFYAVVDVFEDVVVGSMFCLDNLPKLASRFKTYEIDEFDYSLIGNKFATFTYDGDSIVVDEIIEPYEYDRPVNYSQEELMGQQISEVEIQNIMLGLQVSDLEIRLLEGGF